MARRTNVFGSGANTDCLSGGALDNLGPGRYRVWVGASVTTATLTVTVPGVGIIINALPVPVNSTASVVKINELIPVDFVAKPQVGSQQYVRPTIAVGGTTGTWAMTVEKSDSPDFGA